MSLTLVRKLHCKTTSEKKLCYPTRYYLYLLMHLTAFIELKPQHTKYKYKIPASQHYTFSIGWKYLHHNITLFLKGEYTCITTLHLFYRVSIHASQHYISSIVRIYMYLHHITTFSPSGEYTKNSTLISIWHLNQIL